MRYGPTKSLIEFDRLFNSVMKRDSIVTDKDIIKNNLDSIEKSTYDKIIESGYKNIESFYIPYNYINCIYYYKNESRSITDLNSIVYNLCTKFLSGLKQLTLGTIFYKYYDQINTNIIYDLDDLFDYSYIDHIFLINTKEKEKSYCLIIWFNFSDLAFTRHIDKDKYYKAYISINIDNSYNIVDNSATISFFMPQNN